jgi:ferritin
MKPKMVITEECKRMLNDAIYLEMSQSHLWKHIANHMQRAGYFGAQKYFLKESAEELEHYQLIVDFLNDVGTVATVPEIEKFVEPFDTLDKAISKAYDTELDVYMHYSRFYKKEGDPVVQQFLLQFLEIQRKAVGAYGDLLARLSIAGADRAALLIFDQELGG